MQFSSISEDKRVVFTKQLRELRDSDKNQIVFGAELTSDERKFVHKISQDFGLKSKSQGVGEKRFISVLKKASNAQKVSGQAPILWSPNNAAVQLLSDSCFASVANSKQYAGLNRSRQQFTANGGATRSPPTDGQLQQQIAAYHAAQSKRSNHNNYSTIQKKRALLPASHHRMAVCNLLHEHQMVLISGETGE